MESTARERKISFFTFKVSVKLLIAGIPNVGKSQLINKMVNKKAAGVGNMPGFTKGKQWIRIKEGIELLDTPGILWPKFESEQVGLRLAMTGAIKDDILDMEYICKSLIELLDQLGKGKNIKEKYKIEDELPFESFDEKIESIGKKLGYLNKGGVINREKTVLTVVKDFRTLKLGKIVLDII